MKYTEPIKIIQNEEREELLRELNEQFGIKNIPGILFRRGKERIFLYEGYLTEKEIRNLEKITFIERVGVYLAKKEPQGIRLSIEGSQILKNQITKNFVKLTKEEMQEWMMGHELLKKTSERGFVIMIYENDALGTGKASENKITNFIPKSRRLKEKN